MPLTSGGIYYADNSTAMSVADITAAMATSINNAIGAEWTAYTPSISGATRLSGDLYYALSGNIMHIMGSITVSAVSGPISFTIPTGWNINNTIAPVSTVIVGAAGLNDSGTAYYPGLIRAGGTTTCSIVPQLANGTYVGITQTSNTIPFTWASGDSFSVRVTLPVTKV